MKLKPLFIPLLLSLSFGNVQRAFAEELINDQETIAQYSDLIARDFAKVLSDHDPRNSAEENYSIIQESINRLGFVDGLIRPIMISRYLNLKRGDMALVNDIDSLMIKHNLQNGKLDSILSQQAQSEGTPAPGTIVKELGNHYINSRIEDMVGKSSDQLAKDAKNVKTVGEATEMMAQILFHTSVDVAKTAVGASEGILSKGVNLYENGERVNHLKGDERSSDAEDRDAERQRSEQEGKERADKEALDNKKAQEEKERSDKEEDKKREDERKKAEEDKKDKGEKDPTDHDRSQRDTPPTEENHERGEQYLIPDAMVIPEYMRDDEDAYLTKEEKEEKRKAAEKLKNDSVVLKVH
ncbi:MAG: hypothetical protein ACXVCE_06295, partial [Bacteriovorax sp.]